MHTDYIEPRSGYRLFVRFNNSVSGEITRENELKGEVFDVAVDLRKSSRTFGQWVGVHLSAENKKQLWVPEGFAHGFVVLSETAEFLYKTTDYYAPEYERSLLWNDPALGIEWPFEGEPKLAAKDAAAKRLQKPKYSPDAELSSHPARDRCQPLAQPQPRQSLHQTRCGGPLSRLLHGHPLVVLQPAIHADCLHLLL